MINHFDCFNCPTFCRTFCESSLLATYFGVDCVLIVHIANSFRKVISSEFAVDWDIRWYIAMVLLPCLVLAEIRELKYLVPFSAIANLCLLITFGIIAYYMFTGPMLIEERPLFTSWSELPTFFRWVFLSIASVWAAYFKHSCFFALFFSTVIYAIEGIGAMFPIENSMQKPQHFHRVLKTGMVTVVALYVVVGFLGYVRYGDAIEPSITINLPQNEL